MKGDQLKLIDISIPAGHGLRKCAVHHMDGATITFINGVKRIHDVGSGFLVFETDTGKGATIIAQHTIKCVVPT